MMLEVVNERVSVITVYDKDKAEVFPYFVKWKNRKYKITTLGYHHKAKDGRFVHHIFSVSTPTIAFKLRLDTETLIWFLEEVSDGATN